MFIILAVAGFLVIIVVVDGDVCCIVIAVVIVFGNVVGVASLITGVVVGAVDGCYVDVDAFLLCCCC